MCFDLGKTITRIMTKRFREMKTSYSNIFWNIFMVKVEMDS